MMHRGLTTFRFIAFFGVFLAHFNWGLFGTGFLGVQAFFVLSGFLLIPIFVKMKSEFSPRLYFRNFYGRRVLRIFPLYYGYLIVILLVSLFLAGRNIREIDLFLDQAPWALTYSYDFFHASSFFEHSRLITHFWSLAVEEQFYLILPVMVLLIPSKHFKSFLLGAIVLGPLFRLCMALTVKSGVLTYLNSRIDLVIYVLPFSHFDAFAMGGFFALYWKSSMTNLRVLVLFLFTVGVGYFTQYLSTGEILLQSLGYAPFMDYQYVWSYSLINYMFAVLLVQIRDGKLWPRFFDNTYFYYLGNISYGLYVFHFGILWLVSYTLPHVSDPVRFAVSLVATFFVSLLSYEMFEKYFIHMKDRFFSRKNLGIQSSQGASRQAPEGWKTAHS